MGLDPKLAALIGTPVNKEEECADGLGRLLWGRKIASCAQRGSALEASLFLKLAFVQGSPICFIS